MYMWSLTWKGQRSCVKILCGREEHIHVHVSAYTEVLLMQIQLIHSLIHSLDFDTVCVQSMYSARLCTYDVCSYSVSFSGCIPVEVVRRMWRVQLLVSSSYGLPGTYVHGVCV